MKAGEAAGFFGLVLILSLPFYALGTMGGSLPFAPALPLSALMAVVPMIAALGLVWWTRGLCAAADLFTSAFDPRRIHQGVWVILALVTMPAAFALTGGIIWLSGGAMPALQLLPLSAIIPAFVMFFLGAAAEEIGWQGYAYPHLATRHSALTAALTIGAFWALWHAIPFAVMGHGTAWIFWQGAGIVLMRVVIVWLVVNAGQSLPIAVLFHMMSNSVWGMVQDFGPWYDPMVMCGVLLVTVIALVALWGSTTLKRFRLGPHT